MTQIPEKTCRFYLWHDWGEPFSSFTDFRTVHPLTTMNRSHEWNCSSFFFILSRVCEDEACLVQKHAHKHPPDQLFMQVFWISVCCMRSFNALTEPQQAQSELQLLKKQAWRICYVCVHSTDHGLKNEMWNKSRGLTELIRLLMGVKWIRITKAAWTQRRRGFFVPGFKHQQQQWLSEGG